MNGSRSFSITEDSDKVGQSKLKVLNRLIAHNNIFKAWWTNKMHQIPKKWFLFSIDTDVITSAKKPTWKYKIPKNEREMSPISTVWLPSKLFYFQLSYISPTAFLRFCILSTLKSPNLFADYFLASSRSITHHFPNLTPRNYYCNNNIVRTLPAVLIYKSKWSV